MGSTFGGIEISKRALFAQQTALQTTGHNIANANTQGFSRQTVNFVASRPIEAVGLMRSNVPGQQGQGVEFDHITRIREKFLDTQYYNENQSLGDWSIRNDTLTKLEAIVNEPSDTGITKVIQGFWGAWQDLSKEPENVTARAALKEKALALTDAFNQTGKQLDDLSNDLTTNINADVTSVNTTLNQVASLNNEIFRVEGLGNDGNDLRDQRDLLIDQLSKLVNVSVSEASNGYTVKMGNTTLVSGISVTTPLTADNVESSLQSGDLQGGEIAGLLTSRDQYLTSYKFQLNSMVKALVQGDMTVTLPAGTVVPDGTVINGQTYSGTVDQRTLTDDTKATVKGLNGLHELGYSLSDPPQSGIPFFTLQNGAAEFTADSITVNPDIVKNVTNIAASAREYQDTDRSIKVVKGNNDISLGIADIQNQTLSFDPNANGTPILTNGTFSEFLNAIVGQLGVQAQETDRQTTNQQMLVDQVDSRRQAVSGVSLDEEMANMIKYQHSYEAAARTMTTFDEILDKIINGMGHVGMA